VRVLELGSITRSSLALPRAGVAIVPESSRDSNPPWSRPIRFRVLRDVVTPLDLANGRSNSSGRQIA
jgi:hypothetical protein